MSRVFQAGFSQGALLAAAAAFCFADRTAGFGQAGSSFKPGFLRVVPTTPPLRSCIWCNRNDPHCEPMDHALNEAGHHAEMHWSATGGTRTPSCRGSSTVCASSSRGARRSSTATSTKVLATSSTRAGCARAAAVAQLDARARRGGGRQGVVGVHRLRVGGAAVGAAGAALRARRRRRDRRPPRRPLRGARGDGAVERHPLRVRHVCRARRRRRAEDGGARLPRTLHRALGDKGYNPSRLALLRRSSLAALRLGPRPPATPRCRRSAILSVDGAATSRARRLLRPARGRRTASRPAESLSSTTFSTRAGSASTAASAPSSSCSTQSTCGCARCCSAPRRALPDDAVAPPAVPARPLPAPPRRFAATEAAAAAAARGAAQDRAAAAVGAQPRPRRLRAVVQRQRPRRAVRRAHAPRRLLAARRARLARLWR